MIYKLRKGKQINILLLCLSIVGLFICGVSITNALNVQAEDHINAKANLLMQTMLSVRNYTSVQVNPELAQRLETESRFLPQTVPGYSAREVFEDMRKNPEYKEYFYKEATLNPTNLRDKADDFETKLVKEFRSNPNLREVKGYRSNGLFYTAKPLTITKASCLRCHSTPDRAPKSQIASYGSTNGFGWKLNEIVGAQVVTVSAKL
jgi:hypothetical protein